MKDYNIECPECGDYMVGEYSPSKNADYKCTYDAACADCCVYIQHHLPTAEHKKAVHDYFQSLLGEKNG